MQNKVRNGYNFKSRGTIWGNIKLPKVWGKYNLYARLAGEGKTGAAIFGTNWRHLVVGTKGILILYYKPLCINTEKFFFKYTSSLREMFKDVYCSLVYNNRAGNNHSSIRNC